MKQIIELYAEDISNLKREGLALLAGGPSKPDGLPKRKRHGGRKSLDASEGKKPLDSLYLEDIMPPGRLGRMLKTLREAKGLTQVELAKKARIGQGYLAQLEGGVKKNPSLAVLKRLARAVGVSVEQLLK